MACHSLGVQEEVVSPADVKSGLGAVVFPCNTFTAFVCTGRSLPLARAHKVGIMSTVSWELGWSIQHRSIQAKMKLWCQAPYCRSFGSELWNFYFHLKVLWCPVSKVDPILSSETQFLPPSPECGPHLFSLRSTSLVFPEQTFSCGLVLTFSCRLEPTVPFRLWLLLKQFLKLIGG